MTIATVAEASAQSTSIGARSCHAMTHVPGANTVVVIGGARACGVDVVRDSLVWSWNGARWRPIGDPFPSRREDALVTYDTRRQTLVLYGGRTDAIVHRDTWELRDGRWAQRATGTDPNPGALEHAAIGYDERRARTVVFGGGSRDGRTFDATWEFDGTQWRRASAQGPVARVGHAMAWSQSDSAVLLYGGFNAAGSFSDLWKWDGSTWTRLDSAGPATTEGPALVATDRGPILVGTAVGAGADQTLGVWLWRDGKWERLDGGTGPPTRVGQGLAYDATRRRLVLFGGYFPATDRASAETWEFDGRAWRLVSDRPR